MLHTWLDGAVPVFFEHHVVLWKDRQLNIGIRSMKGAFKRMVAGMPIFLTGAQGPGEIAFSRDGAGHLFPLHLLPSTSVLVREHQFLAATGNLEYTFNRVKGITNMMFASPGFSSIGLKTGIFGGGGNMVWNRFTGPGRVEVQSMYMHLPTS
ncbi:MAG TPA: AIM24 family protein, partial [Candidatus Dormibacteraeota bacterium]